ncbi:hypothetical protein Pmar_PMAR000655 [Perkinsus marinus ATCC 50983]|uniref:Uncharacterized protein n=1 Tax=Perkinsus marinus (strain ATCC 50983 / TXsc) TaxID=423536 RepID=C5KRE7_PERM5|nr:hypothetical protein Pmar_PMAR001785 [Perkinsus marinus ATCC 50983]XP_002781125.1 hypothetical protein Pmar_PMAR000655 [Perkinsus marinus ATCC 50983]EER03040.1 hypothetical protein Pmar_PMAR001785 [Perkinsus marinus ATCC 50983]EER12920.1 hypothetical protein Pmar_PMAR000655 [Perkinsus marinus ATCC 50983]|eukprot:XP_002771224.1 hypothetical protein Pmar_PMAR001785 [Perkinsus marinus ATCC 50983]
MANSVASRAVLAAKNTVMVRESIDKKEDEAVKYWSERKESIEKEIGDLSRQADEYRRMLDEIDKKISRGIGQGSQEAVVGEKLNEFPVDVDTAKPVESRERLAAQLRLLEVFGSSEAIICEQGTCKLKLVPRHHAQIESTEGWAVGDFDLTTSVEDNWKKLASMLGA